MNRIRLLYKDNKTNACDIYINHTLVRILYYKKLEEEKKTLECKNGGYKKRETLRY